MNKSCIYVSYPDFEGRYNQYECQCGYTQYKIPPSIGYFCPLCGRRIVNIVDAPGYGNSEQRDKTKRILAGTNFNY